MARTETEYSLKKIGPTFSRLSKNDVYLAPSERKIITDLIQLIGLTSSTSDPTDDLNLI